MLFSAIVVDSLVGKR